LQVGPGVTSPPSARKPLRKLNGLKLGNIPPPGKAYVGGEEDPEFFVPKKSGTVVPSLKLNSGKSGDTHTHLHLHGVTDADSFKRSQSQILTQIANATSRAMSRR
jgi:hypothetical protein